MQYELVVDTTDISTYQLGLRKKASDFKDFERIVVPTGYLDSVSGSKKLTSIIDFPYGISDTSLRLQEIKFALKYNADIDLVISQRYQIDRNTEKIYEDFLECKKAVSNGKKELRAMLEYRLNPTRITVEIATILDKAGLNTLILGVSMPDNTTDLILLCRDILKNTDLSLVVGTTDLNDDVISSLEKVGVSCVRRRFLSIFN